MTKIPRIAEVAAEPNATLRITWRDGGTDHVALAGWIATGGELLAPLARADIFATARIGEYGGDVEWTGSDDLGIDSYHLSLLAAEQHAFGPEDLKSWQLEAGLSNNEAADLFGIGLSTWNDYRAGTSPIPGAVRIAARAALRDPLVMQAHYRPRKPGRPRVTIKLPAKKKKALLEGMSSDSATVKRAASVRKKQKPKGVASRSR
jgi:hypothetical protein